MAWAIATASRRRPAVRSCTGHASRKISAANASPSSAIASGGARSSIFRRIRCWIRIARDASCSHSSRVTDESPSPAISDNVSGATRIALPETSAPNWRVTGYGLRGAARSVRVESTWTVPSSSRARNAPVCTNLTMCHRCSSIDVEPASRTRQRHRVTRMPACRNNGSTSTVSFSATLPPALRIHTNGSALSPRTRRRVHGTSCFRDLYNDGSMLTPPRVVSEELLDEHDAPRADVERSLRDLRRFNRWGGGGRIYRSLVRRFAPRSVLDIGAGTCELVESLPGSTFRIGLDFKIDHLLSLRERSSVHRGVVDALRLPFRNGAVDAVTSNHFFHHFSAAENESILAEALRVARRGVDGLVLGRSAE